jgi:hypothetical protein
MIAASDFELFVAAPIGLIAWWCLRCVLNNMADRREERDRYGPKDWS